MNDETLLQFRLAGFFFRLNLQFNKRDLPDVSDMYAPQWALAYARAAIESCDIPADEESLAGVEEAIRKISDLPVSHDFAV